MSTATGNFIVYTRCSTEEQGKKGNSHEYQVDGIRRSGVVRVAGMSEVAYFYDTVTGTRFDNRASGLDAAYKLCERQRGAVAFLFVYRWDRLGRDVADCFECIKKFRAVGVEVNCPDEWIDFTDPSYPLILSVKFGMAQSESMRISDRTRDGLYQAQSSGFWTAHAPVGYRKGPPRNFGGKDRRVCEPNEKAPIIRECFERYADGETKAELKRRFMAPLGINKSQFIRMFHNPFYCGLVYLKAHRGHAPTVVPGHHEAIVSRDLFDRCQRVQTETDHPTLGKSWSQSRAVVGAEFWAKGVIRCPHTGRNMTAYRSKGRHGGRFPYYSSQKVKGGQIIPAGRAHHLIGLAIAGFKLDPETYAEIRAEVQRQFAVRISTASKEAQDAKKGIERSRSRLDKIRLDFADGNISAAEHRDISRRFDADLVGYEQALLAAEAKMSANDDTIEQVLTLLSGIDTVFAAAAPTYKTRILKAMFPEGVFLDTKTGKVRTPCVNEIILELCSKSILYAGLEIENGSTANSQPAKGGQPDKYRTHLNALKLLFAA